MSILVERSLWLRLSAKVSLHPPEASVLRFLLRMTVPGPPFPCKLQQMNLPNHSSALSAFRVLENPLQEIIICILWGFLFVM